MGSHSRREEIRVPLQEPWVRPAKAATRNMTKTQPTLARPMATVRNRRGRNTLAFTWWDSSKNSSIFLLILLADRSRARLAQKNQGIPLSCLKFVSKTAEGGWR